MTELETSEKFAEPYMCVTPSLVFIAVVKLCVGLELYLVVDYEATSDNEKYSC